MSIAQLTKQVNFLVDHEIGRFNWLNFHLGGVKNFTIKWRANDGLIVVEDLNFVRPNFLGHPLNEKGTIFLLVTFDGQRRSIGLADNNVKVIGGHFVSLDEEDCLLVWRSTFQAFPINDDRFEMRLNSNAKGRARHCGLVVGQLHKVRQISGGGKVERVHFRGTLLKRVLNITITGR